MAGPLGARLPLHSWPTSTTQTNPIHDLQILYRGRWAWPSYTLTKIITSIKRDRWCWSSCPSLQYLSSIARPTGVRNGKTNSCKWLQIEPQSSSSRNSCPTQCFSSCTIRCKACSALPANFGAYRSWQWISLGAANSLSMKGHTCPACSQSDTLTRKAKDMTCIVCAEPSHQVTKSQYVWVLNTILRPSCESRDRVCGADKYDLR